MKTKHIIATTSAAIIAGSVFYLARRSNNGMPELKPLRHLKAGEDKIRQVMHHAKESHS